MNIILSKEKINYSLLLFISFINLFFLGMTSFLGMPLQTVVIFSVLLIIVFVQVRLLQSDQNKKDYVRDKLVFLVMTPIFLSCFQNVIYALFSNNMSSTQLQLLLSLNFIIAITEMLIFSVNIKFRLNSIYFYIFTLLVFLALYAMLMSLYFNPDILAAISSFRNILSPFIFSLLGMASSKFCRSKNMAKGIAFLSMIVFFIGIYELYLDNQFWTNLNLSGLWQKKGISTFANGLPGNFFSSETINGNPLRRMVSSFADPINLGTFLFGAFVCCYYLKKRYCMICLGIGCILVVSKGTMLGFMVFLVVWFYYKMPKKYFITMMLLMFATGIILLIYMFHFSSGSVFLHIRGLVISFIEMFYYPFGRGVGKVGVLSNLFSQNIGISNILSENFLFWWEPEFLRGATTNIAETGLGMIIGQLGFIGLSVYMMFFYKLVKYSSLLEEETQKIVCLTLSISIFLNILFNEVALSPNSCAVYFLVTGMILGESDRGRMVKK